MTRVEVDGRELALTNLEKVLWPEIGWTKGQMIEYYVAVAPVLLPHHQVGDEIRHRAGHLAREPLRVGRRRERRVDVQAE